MSNVKKFLNTAFRAIGALLAGNTSPQNDLLDAANHAIEEQNDEELNNIATIMLSLQKGYDEYNFHHAIVLVAAVLAKKKAYRKEAFDILIEAGQYMPVSCDARDLAASVLDKMEPHLTPTDKMTAAAFILKSGYTINPENQEILWDKYTDKILTYKDKIPAPERIQILQESANTFDKSIHQNVLLELVFDTILTDAEDLPLSEEIEAYKFIVEHAYATNKQKQSSLLKIQKATTLNYNLEQNGPTYIENMKYFIYNINKRNYLENQDLVELKRKTDYATHQIFKYAKALETKGERIQLYKFLVENSLDKSSPLWRIYNEAESIKEPLERAELFTYILSHTTHKQQIHNNTLHAIVDTTDDLPSDQAYNLLKFVANKLTETKREWPLHLIVLGLDKATPPKKIERCQYVIDHTNDTNTQKEACEILLKATEHLPLEEKITVLNYVLEKDLPTTLKADAIAKLKKAESQNGFVVGSAQKTKEFVSRWQQKAFNL